MAIDWLLRRTYPDPDPDPETKIPPEALHIPTGCRLGVEDISSTQRKKGIQWTPQTQIDDSGFADDQSVHSTTQLQMQGKTRTVADHSASLGLKAKKRQKKVLENSGAVSTTPLHRMERH